VPAPPLRILFEDNHCLAVVKRAGIVTTHFQGKEETLDRIVKAYLKTKYGKPGNVFLGVVQRLDRPVSGVLLFARTSKAAARLAEQFRTGLVRKLYWAVVQGNLESQSETYDDWLLKDTVRRRVQVVVPATPAAQSASLQWKRLHATAKLAWLEIVPRTGRKHQLRAQFAHRGHPIIGDRRYGAFQPFTPDAIALHARSLTFQHPVRRESITLTAPLPSEWFRFFPFIPREAADE
jgi:23S rRNA pseudouridine1911/1915/1917 synthase